CCSPLWGSARMDPDLERPAGRRRSQLSVVAHPGPQAQVFGDWQLAPDAALLIFTALLVVTELVADSAAQAEASNQGPVALDVVVADVVEQPATTADQHEQTPTAVMVLLVDLQVVGELVDAL